MKCEICGAEFEATRSSQRYCSRAECKRERKRRNLNAWRRANRKAVNLQSVMKCVMKCEICGAEFEPKCKTQRYCSRAECKREGLRRWQRANRKALKLQSVMKCEICGAEFEPKRKTQRYCSRAECKREGLRRWRRANRKALKLQEEFHDLGKPLSIAEARELVK